MAINFVFRNFDNMIMKAEAALGATLVVPQTETFKPDVEPPAPPQPTVQTMDAMDCADTVIPQPSEPVVAAGAVTSVAEEDVLTRGLEGRTS